MLPLLKASVEWMVYSGTYYFRMLKSSYSFAYSIGPVDLTEGTLFPSLFSTIPTVTDNLASQGTIPTEEIGVSFEPTTSEVANNGELTFGGTDSSKYTGSITYT